MSGSRRDRQLGPASSASRSGISAAGDEWLETRPDPEFSLATGGPPATAPGAGRERFAAADQAPRPRRRDRGAADAGVRKARLSGIRVPLPVETLNSKLASLPRGGDGRARPDRGAVQRGDKRVVCGRGRNLYPPPANDPMRASEHDTRRQKRLRTHSRASKSTRASAGQQQLRGGPAPQEQGRDSTLAPN